MDLLEKSLEGNRGVSWWSRVPLTFGPKIAKGDKKGVNIVEDRDILAEYVGDRLGFYQTFFGMEVLSGNSDFKNFFSLHVQLVKMDKH